MHGRSTIVISHGYSPAPKPGKYTPEGCTRCPDCGRLVNKGKDCRCNAPDRGSGEVRVTGGAKRKAKRQVGRSEDSPAQRSECMICGKTFSHSRVNKSGICPKCRKETE